MASTRPAGALLLVLDCLDRQPARYARTFWPRGRDPAYMAP
ncbi:hypothetical protein AB0K16_32075 [Nonomuraea jabiensis]